MSSWTGGSLFNFKRPTLRAASPPPEAAPTLSRGLISAGPTSIISRRPPQDYILPRDHPWPTDFIRPEEAMEEDAWKYVWRDEEFFEELGPQDAQILVETAGINHFFDNTNDGGFTVSGGCGHISKGIEFHWLCRVCQYLTTRELCCTRYTNKCSVGDMVKDLDAEKFERVRVNRHNLQSAVRDKTSSLQMQWLGSDPYLKTTAVGRLAYAVGAGATDLAEVLSQLQVMTRELEIDDLEFKVKR